MADDDKPIEQEMEEELSRVPNTTGWLGKKAVRTATKMKWKERYFELTPKARKLEYMKRPQGKPILSFTVDKKTKVRVANKFKDHEMEVVFDAHTLYAHSIDPSNPDDDIRTWVDRIQQIIDAQDPLKLGEKKLERRKEKERQEEEERLSKLGKLPVEHEGGKNHGGPEQHAAIGVPAIDPSEPNPNERVMPGRRRMVQQRAPPPPPRPSSPPPKNQPGEDVAQEDNMDLVSRIISVVRNAQQNIGRCYTWGSNWHGKLGTGEATATEKPLPTFVPALMQSHCPECVDAGGSHCLAITQQGMLFAWGDNKYKQLGTGDGSKQTVYKSLRPILVSGLRKKPIAQIACGSNHCMALTYGGDLYSWGDGSTGALGIGELEESTSAVGTPTKVKKIGRGTDLGIEIIRAGSSSSGAITSDGDCYVWGSNVTGQLGTGLDTVGLNIWEPTRALIELDDYVTPHDPNDDLGVLDVSFGERFSVWLVNDGVLLVCGALSMTNSDFFDKQSDTEWIIQNCDTPHLTADLQMDVLFRKISAGPDMVVALSKDGSLYSAGRGYLGNSDSNESIIYPVQNQKCQFTLAADGRRVPADHNGNPIDTSYGVCKSFVPVLSVPPEEHIAEIAVGNIFAMLRTVDGRLYGWGSSSKGELATSQMVEIPRPREIRTAELDNMHYSQLSAGNDFCCAIAKPGVTGTLRFHWLARKYAAILYKRCLKRDAGKDFGRKPDFEDTSADRAEELEYVFDDLANQADMKKLFEDPDVKNALANANEEV